MTRPYNDRDSDGADRETPLAPVPDPALSPSRGSEVRRPATRSAVFVPAGVRLVVAVVAVVATT